MLLVGTVPMSRQPIWYINKVILSTSLRTAIDLYNQITIKDLKQK